MRKDVKAAEIAMMGQRCRDLLESTTTRVAEG
jgi:hypothetical protein